MEKHLHIISFNVPYPADYGGVIDVFWKLPYLQKLGIKIHLHCFDYGRGEQKILKQFCEEVHYYKRYKGVQYLFSTLPFIVATRQNEILEARLLKDNYPILCEGVHTSALILNKNFSNRKIFVRLHNVEHEYYQQLKSSTNNIIKKIFFWRESILLKKYEALIANSTFPLLALSELDAKKFKTIFNAHQVHYLPFFIPDNWKVNTQKGIGSYCLYHGDLSVAANEKSVIWLIENVVAKLPNITFYFAGKNPSISIVSISKKYENIKLIKNPSDEELQELIQQAQVNILPSFNSSGIKLKLLNALYNGRFCIVNNETVMGSGLEELCVIANSPEEFINSIQTLMNKNFIEENIETRKQLLTKKFNNFSSAELLVEYIFY